jgi:pre-mRNA-processing factor SLU7
VHLNALPTLTAKAHLEFQKKREDLETKQRSTLLQKYGGQEHMQPALSAAERMAVSEAYVEYALDGSVVKGAAPAVPRSKYEEDVFRFHHTSVWGSFWREGQWGYACCKSTVRNSYCLGEKAAAADSAMSEIMTEELAKLASPAPGATVSPRQPNKQNTVAPANSFQHRARSSIDSDVPIAEADIEEYRKGKLLASDPMAGYVDPEDSGFAKKQRRST